MLKLLLVVVGLPASILLAALITLPTSVESQLALGVTLVAGMVVVRYLPGRAWRGVFLTFAGVIVGRYIYWRLTQTIPDPANLWDFIPGVVLVVAELYCLLMFMISALIVADPFERPRKKAPPAELAPTVDIFIPTYNEDPELVAVTLAAAVDLDYPREKMRVYLLDDGGTEEKVNAFDVGVAHEAALRRKTLQDLCTKLGATYLTRERNHKAKAGNLNNGLAQSDGELIVVFDADHAPSREFLQKTVGYFDDPKMFLVQTPHFFLNPDPVEKNLSTFDRMPSENDMFYRLVQKGLDKWDATFFCGSAAVLRRTALDEVGGFSGTSITEDCETALELHSRGWSSAYVDRPMIAGLQPETFSSFIGQRSRWCRGMLQILLLKSPLRLPGLSLMQRVCYLSSALFWLFPFSRLVFLAAPLLFILFDLKVYVASPQEFFAYTAVYMLAMVVVQSALYGRFRWPWISELYEYLQSFYLFPAIMSVIADPRAPKFNVTDKGQTLARNELSVIAWPYFLVFGVLVATTGVLYWRFMNDTGSTSLLIVIGAWHLFNLFIAGAALGAVCERREVRRSPRVRTRRKGFIEVREQLLPVLVEEANSNGLLIRPQAALPFSSVINQQAKLIIDPLPVTGTEREPLSVEVRVVSQRTLGANARYGLAFHDSPDVKARVVGDLVHGDLTIPRSVHSGKLVKSSALFGSLRIVAWAFRQSGRAVLLAVQSSVFKPRRRNKAEADVAPAAFVPAE